MICTDQRHDTILIPSFLRLWHKNCHFSAYKRAKGRISIDIYWTWLNMNWIKFRSEGSYKLITTQIIALHNHDSPTVGVNLLHDLLTYHPSSPAGTGVPRWKRTNTRGGYPPDGVCKLHTKFYFQYLDQQVPYWASFRPTHTSIIS